jgi:hypothetical protein
MQELVMEHPVAVVWAFFLFEVMDVDKKGAVSCAKSFFDMVSGFSIVS